MDTRDIVEQLQDACDLATDKRELERLCGNAKIEIERLRIIEAAAVAAVDCEQWQGGTWYDLMIALQKALHGQEPEWQNDVQAAFGGMVQTPQG